MTSVGVSVDWRAKVAGATTTAKALADAWRDRAATADAKAARRVRRITLGLIGVLGAQVALLLADAVFPPDMGKAERSSPVVLDRHGAWLRALPVDRGRWRVRADLERTDPSFLRRVTAVEDERFFAHLGVDPMAVVRAALTDFRASRTVSGGSTITMQTARLLMPHPRSYVAKVVEMLRAIQLEARLSKPQILSLYLTLAPYGGNLEGVRAASLSYFGHEPESLTLGEQALLIALPQAPEARRPDRRPAAARAARREVLQKLLRAGAIDASEFAEADAEPLPTGRTAFPHLAWHATGRLARAAATGQATIQTTLDASLQARLENLARKTALDQGAETECRHPGDRGEDPRGARGGGLGGPRPAGRLGEHDARAALARIVAEAVCLRFRLRRGHRRARHRTPGHADPLRRLPAGGLRPRVPRRGDRARSPDQFAERAGGGDAGQARPRRVRGAHRAGGRALGAATRPDQGRGAGAGARRRGNFGRRPVGALRRARRRRRGQAAGLDRR